MTFNPLICLKAVAAASPTRLPGLVKCIFRTTNIYLMFIKENYTNKHSGRCKSPIMYLNPPCIKKELAEVTCSKNHDLQGIKIGLEMQVQNQGQGMGRSLPRPPLCPSCSWAAAPSVRALRDTASVLKEQGRPSSEKRTFSPKLWWNYLA